MLLDRNNYSGSDTGGSPTTGDSFANEQYEPGQQFRGSYQNAPLTDDDAYQSQNAGSSLDLDDDDAYQSQNAGRSAADDFPEEANSARQSKLRENMSDSAWQAFQRAKAVAGKRSARAIGQKVFGDKNILTDDSKAGRDKVKELAQNKARKFAKDQIGKKIANKGLQTGFKRGISQGAKKVAGNAAKNAGKQAVKAATKGLAKAGTKIGTQAAVGGVEAGIAGAGVAAGSVTFGLGLVLAFLLDIAISLGVNDAIDAVFELKNGDFKQARFLAIRAAMKVGMFIVFLLAMVSIFSIAGVIIALPIMLFLNIYMLLGIVFPKIAIFQGFVWWERALIIIMDVMLFITVMAILAGIAWYICDQSGLGSSGVAGTFLTGVAKVIDWWNGTEYATTVTEMCKSIKAF